MCVCVCTPRERITSTVEMARWRGKKERERGELGATFSRTASFISPENWNRSDARVKTTLQSSTKVVLTVYWVYVFVDRHVRDL